VDHDAKAFGAQWAALARVSVFPALVTALEGDPARRTAFLDRLEQDVAAQLAATPQEIQIPLAKVVLAKRGRTP
jgi:hypothetical protein